MKRWMMFVDGENLTIRAQNKDRFAYLTEGRYFLPDVFVWHHWGHHPMSFAAELERRIVLTSRLSVLESDPIRAYYYTSLADDEPRVQAVREALWILGLYPRVFKKARLETKAKGVDIALATDMLSDAYLDNFDAAVLAAGDAGYVPIVDEVQHIGKQVFVCFFDGPDSGLGAERKLASDGFVDMGFPFFESHRQLAEQ